MLKQFNLKIDERTYRNLARLARAGDRSKAATIRTLIRLAVEREFGAAGVARHSSKEAGEAAHVEAA